MFLGLWARLSTLAAGGLVGVMYLYGVLFRTVTWGAHNTYLLFIATFLCALMPSGNSYSLDRWIAIRRGGPAGVPPERGNLWAQRLLMIQVGLVYFWSAFDKTGPGYFSGARVEQILMGEYFGSLYPDWWLGFHPMCVALGWATVLTEYTLGFGLFVRRLRPWLIAIGIVFHTMIYLTLSVATFSMTMILLYLCFFDPDQVHRWIDEMQAPSTGVDRERLTLEAKGG